MEWLLKLKQKKDTYLALQVQDSNHKGGQLDVSILA